MKKNTATRTKAYKTFSIIVITLLAISLLDYYRIL